MILAFEKKPGKVIVNIFKTDPETFGDIFTT
jgi:hypothetical protein